MSLMVGNELLGSKVGIKDAPEMGLGANTMPAYSMVNCGRKIVV